MSYQIYTTKGIVLSERPVREADRVYNILTRDFGLMRVSALGTRKESSKLRGHIEPFSLAYISLVRGKEHWRATSAEYIRNIPATPSVARPLSLLEKLIQGEVSHPELFDAIEEYLESDETTLVSRILFHLGYLKEEDLNLDKKALIRAINDGLQSSHLA
ncbi:MAG: recombination protein O N-terminal domain-containing protein [Candidatus Zambryskibacteria bacterium]|nr:recombination protein O N-terminal domain-containing protein [Candidatus Zambryskibacteria bacterium]